MTINWQPIETAPKCGRRILLRYAVPLFTGVSTIFGKWEEDKFAYKPKPHFTHDLRELYGAKNTRANQPIAWSDDANESQSEG